MFNMNWKLLVSFLFSTILLSACTPNKAYRTDGMSSCIKNSCESASIEEYSDNYALAFVEFSERGNVFNRERMNEILKYIEQEEQKPDGVMVLVYVHGWHHNASNDSQDVIAFRKTLSIINKNRFDNRKVIGVYVGWRGESLSINPVNLITYWGRKNTARQVGNGGVTELFMRLERITSNNSENNKNIFVISGHSLGAAVTLTAVKDIILDRLVNAKHLNPKQCAIVNKFESLCNHGCYQSDKFGDGIVLLNPAVEANELIQIKELIGDQRCYNNTQPKLLRIISSKADIANRYAFPVGQYIGVSLTDKEAILKREVYLDAVKHRDSVFFSEKLLDTITVGNYPPFRTDWDINNKYIHCQEQKNKNCLADVEKQKFNFHIPTVPSEPISILYVDQETMKGHNDIFNEEVLSYIGATIIENQYKRNHLAVNKLFIKACVTTEKKYPKYVFKACENLFRKRYKAYFK